MPTGKKPATKKPATKKPMIKAHQGKTPKKLETKNDDTRHYKESIPEFKKRRNAFRASEAKKREAAKKKK